MSRNCLVVLVSCAAALTLVACGSSSGGGGGGGTVPFDSGAGSDAQFGADAGTGGDALTDAKPSCTDECALEGEILCSSDTVAAICKSGSDGCLHVITSKDCASGQTCVDGVCKKPICVPKCDGSTCGSDGCGGACVCSGGLTCQAGFCEPPAVCGNGKCELGETTANCQQDCKPPATCGDGTCGNGETAVTCPGDCKCAGKDSFCDPDGLSLHFCDAGSGKLAQKGCAAVCGDKGMTFTKCDTDASDGIAYCFCKKCGDGKCSFGESYATCPSDCACTPSDNVCASSAQANVCDASTKKLVPLACSDSACAAANYGKSLGCGAGLDGTINCQCKKQGCGDGVCQGNESKASCPADCVGCTTNSSCGSGQVCQSTIKQCASADGATYKLTIKSGTAPAKTSSGGYWDTLDNSLPDPYIEVFLNGTKLCATTFVDDTTKPVWNVTCSKTLKMTAADTLKFVMWDDDYGLDDELADDVWTGADLTTMLANGGNNGAMIGTVGLGTAMLSVAFEAQ